MLLAHALLPALRRAGRPACRRRSCAAAGVRRSCVRPELPTRSATRASSWAHDRRRARRRRGDEPGCA
jgi:hypothetical protein